MTGQNPSARNGNSFTAHCTDDSRFICFGGLGGKRYSDTYVLSHTNGERFTWRAPAIKGNLPTPRTFHTAWSALLPIVEYGEQKMKPYFFVSGGQNDDRESLSCTNALDLETWTWRKLFCQNNLPPSRDSASAIHVPEDGRTFVFGGRSLPENMKRSDFWVLDYSAADFSYHSNPSQTSTIAGCDWDEVIHNPMSTYEPWPSARQNTPFCVLGTTIYMFGGLLGERDGEFSVLGFPDDGLQEGKAAAVSEELWTFSIPDLRWRKLRTMGKAPSARYAHQLWTASDTELAVWGGLDGEHRFQSVIHILDLYHMHWSTPYVGGLCPTRRYHFGCTSFNHGVAVRFSFLLNDFDPNMLKFTFQFVFPQISFESKFKFK